MLLLSSKIVKNGNVAHFINLRELLLEKGFNSIYHNYEIDDFMFVR